MALYLGKGELNFRCRRKHCLYASKFVLEHSAKNHSLFRVGFARVIPTAFSKPIVSGLLAFVSFHRIQGPHVIVGDIGWGVIHPARQVEIGLLGLVVKGHQILRDRSNFR